MIGTRKELARERAWIDELPFDVVDYEDCLGDAPARNDDPVRIVLAFEDPTAAELAPFFASDNDGNWTLDAQIAKARFPLLEIELRNETWDDTEREIR